MHNMLSCYSVNLILSYVSYTKGLTMTKYRQFKSISWKQLPFSLVVMSENITHYEILLRKYYAYAIVITLLASKEIT